MIDSSYPKGLIVKQISWELERMPQLARERFIKAQSEEYTKIINKSKRYYENMQECMSKLCKNCTHEQECFSNNEVEEILCRQNERIQAKK